MYGKLHCLCGRICGLLLYLLCLPLVGSEFTIINTGTVDVNISVFDCAGTDLGDARFLAAGSTLHYSSGFPTGTEKLFHYNWTGCGTAQLGACLIIPSGGTVVETIHPTSAGCDLGITFPDWKTKVCVTNNTLGTVRYRVQIHTTGGADSTVDAALPSASGEVYCFEYSNQQKADIVVQAIHTIFNEDGSEFGDVADTAGGIGSGSSNWWRDGDTPNPPTPTRFDGIPVNPGLNGTNNPSIGGTGQGTGLALESTQVAVGSTLHDDLNRGFSTVNNAILGLKGSLGGTGAVSDALTHTKLDSVLAGQVTALAQSTAASIAALGRLDTLHADFAPLAGGFATNHSDLTGIRSDLASLLAKADTANGLSSNEIAFLGQLNLTATNIVDQLAIIVPDVDAIRLTVGSMDTNLLAGVGLLAASTNLLGQVAGATAGLNTNVSGLRGDVQAVAAMVGSSGNSNRVALTNGFGELARVLEAATNILGTISRNTGTNDSRGPINSIIAAQASAGATSGEAGKAVFDSLAAGVPSYSGPARMASVAGSFWEVKVPKASWYLTGSDFWTVNLDPLSYPKLVVLSSYVRNLATWFVVIGFVGACLSVLESYVRANTAQAMAAEKQPILSSLIALACALAITATVAALPVFYFTYFGGNPFGTLSSNPFDSPFEIVQAALYLADLFFPLALIVSYTLEYFTFRYTVGGVWWLSQAISRALVG